MQMFYIWRVDSLGSPDPINMPFVSIWVTESGFECRVCWPTIIIAHPKSRLCNRSYLQTDLTDLTDWLNKRAFGLQPITIAGWAMRKI